MLEQHISRRGFLGIFLLPVTISLATTSCNGSLGERRTKARLINKFEEVKQKLGGDLSNVELPITLSYQLPDVTVAVREVNLKRIDDVASEVLNGAPDDWDSSRPLPDTKIRVLLKQITGDGINLIPIVINEKGSSANPSQGKPLRELLTVEPQNFQSYTLAEKFYNENNHLLGVNAGRPVVYWPPNYWPSWIDAENNKRQLPDSHLIFIGSSISRNDIYPSLVHELIHRSLAIARENEGLIFESKDGDNSLRLAPAAVYRQLFEDKVRKLGPNPTTGFQNLEITPYMLEKAGCSSLEEVAQIIFHYIQSFPLEEVLCWYLQWSHADLLAINQDTAKVKLTMELEKLNTFRGSMLQPVLNQIASENGDTEMVRLGYSLEQGLQKIEEKLASQGEGGNY